MGPLSSKWCIVSRRRATELRWLKAQNVSTIRPRPELMRRTAQFQFEVDANGRLDQSALDGAIEEMVFAGGTLNLKLLGGSSAELTAGQDVATRATSRN